MLAVGLSRGRLSPVVVWLVLVTVLPVNLGSGETFDVPGDRAKTIGQAVSLAEQNTDTSNVIVVATGDYTETPLTITKSLTIRGGDGVKAVVRAASDPLVVIDGAASTVTLANLILITSGTAIRISAPANAVLRNLVIRQASTAIRCEVQTTTASVDHITFFQVTNGVDCQTSTIPIRNNVFSVVSGTPILPFSVVGAVIPNYNLFHAATGPTGERGDNAFPNANDTADDPKFVDSANNDFHLQEGSAAIDKGVSLIGEPVDLGAYGGSLITPVPFPPGKPSVTCTSSPAECTVSWTRNLDHKVGGYQVLSSAPSAPNPDYDTTTPVSNSAAGCDISASPPPRCSLLVGSLPDTGTAPADPSTPTARFGDSKVQLDWPAVSGATAYEVYVQTAPNSIVAGTPDYTVSSPAKTVEGLSNGTTYYFAVRAVNQPTFYAAVESVSGTVSGVVTIGVSDTSEAADPVAYGTAVFSGLSSEVSSIPQPVVAFPPLEDTGGCFIATAAYGSALAPQVDVLRAFRERYLRPHATGRAVIGAYETWSPPFADAIRSSDGLRLVVRVLLWPLVGLAWMALYAPWWLSVVVVGMAAIAVRFVLVRFRGTASA